MAKSQKSNCVSFLMLSVLGITSDYILNYFSYFSQKTGFDILCKLSEETICMKCQSLFSENIRKTSFICCPTNLPSVINVKSISSAQ